jgi:site-specific DNA-methyltransferase (adenine-specific)
MTLARKPLMGSVSQTVLKYGTGGINIDFCRIGAGQIKQATAGRRTIKWGICEGGCSYEKGTGAEFSKEGRWPANLILEHKPNCKVIGECEVKTGTAYEPEKGREMQHQIYGDRKTLGGTRGYANEDGTETIPKWDCRQGCPVAGLDKQVGYLHPSGNMSDIGSGKDVPFNASSYDISYKGRALRDFHDQGGGASRFFKQIQDSEITL